MSSLSAIKIIRKNVPTSKRRDIYHDLLAMNWGVIFVCFLFFFLILNSIFATLYWIAPGSLHNSDNSWLSCFFFSVQTLGTIGYGYLAPATTYANILVTIEATMGLVIIAILGGLFFAKFSRPHSKLEFSNNAVVTDYNGVPTLIFRMINIRKNQIIDSKVSLNLLREERTIEGHVLRRFVDLKLARSSVPMFAMSMNIMHAIDQESPLFGLKPDEIVKSQMEFYVTMVGTDGTFGQTIHATHVYRASDLLWGKKFKDMVELRADGTRVIDYAHFHEVI